MSTLNDSLLGKQVDEYRIDKALGQGGMARVYRALDVKLERYVALKVIAPDFRAEEEYSARFAREAQSIARLNHPNIVHIYRFGETDGIYYMAMQYVEGVDVGWLIQDYRASSELMPVPDVLRIIQDISGALDYAHSKNVIHRDIKPSNIMVDSQGRAILTDFGLALLSDQGTRGQIFGSPHYISPEQAISSGNVVPQSDLYALGVTLFEMLTGELPFSGGEPMDIAMKHVSEQPPLPSQFNRAIPSAVDEVVLKSLAKEPYERYVTGADFSSALQEAIAKWPADNAPLSEETRRPSLVRTPQKVDELMRIAPVPSLSTPLPRERASLADTLLPSPAGPTQPGPQGASTAQKSAWFYPLLLAAILFTLGLIGLILVMLLSRNDNANTIAAAGTATTSPTSIPPTSVQSETAALPQTITLAPTLAPTFTPVVLASTVPPTAVVAAPTLVPPPTLLPPTSITVPPTALPPPTSTPKIVPPANRYVVPPNSVRLGEFAVEGYCNTRGYGVALVNNNNDWACTNPSTRAVVLILGPSDFDSICQARYGNPAAFAIRDQQKAVQAYNWSCYAYVIPPTAVPPTSTPPLGITPSLSTLTLNSKATWIALVNISTVPVSLDQVVFKHEDRTLTSSAWGKMVLNPGECLRIFRDDTPPQELPAKCTTVFDYAADKTEREFWLNGPTYVSINPTITYCYPAKLCQN